MKINKSWTDYTYVAVDLETTGKYPIESEICEVGAVKWKNGQILGKYSTLLKPNSKMSDEVIKIHNITNEMVQEAPKIENTLQDFNEFIKGGIVIAHHAPFDVGFLAVEYEKLNIQLPDEPAICSSLLSRNVITDSPNHRLQTLVKHLGIDGGSAHRALDDANSCLLLAIECFKKMGEVSLLDILKKQKHKIYWYDYSIDSLQQITALASVVEACKVKKSVKVVYDGGSKPGKPRIIYPTGIVRNPNGDFVAASDSKDGLIKRFYLNRIKESTLI